MVHFAVACNKHPVSCIASFPSSGNTMSSLCPVKACFLMHCNPCVQSAPCNGRQSMQIILSIKKGDRRPNASVAQSAHVLCRRLLTNVIVTEHPWITLEGGVHLIAEGAPIALVMQKLQSPALPLCSGLIKRLQRLWICANTCQKFAGLLPNHLLPLIACTYAILHCQCLFHLTACDGKFHATGGRYQVPQDTC